MKRSRNRPAPDQGWQGQSPDCPWQCAAAAGRRPFALAGKVSLITGAAQRLGAALATGLAARGSQVALHYHSSGAAARALATKLRRAGAAVEIFEADLERAEECALMAEAVLERFGTVDVLVHSAARFEQKAFTALTLDDWNRHLDLNLRAGFLLAQSLAPRMNRRGGKMLFLADIAADRPWRGYLPYCVSKAGVVALTRALAKELAPRIQVNAIAPGTVLPPASFGTEQRERLVRRIPLGRLGSPQDVVATALFLLEGTDYITGAVVPVDGGRGLH
jgi:NAD(P)-dependent dehydrogenase (short-subunit alcohol dehydrogenase family)